MKLIYENEFGTCTMKGSGAGGMAITEVSGLSFPEQNAVCYTYAGTPGQSVGAVQVLARTITIGLDICPKKLGMDIHAIARIFNHPGALTVSHKQMHRRILCRCVSFTKKEREDAIISAVVQLVADNPYFHDTAPREHLLLKFDKHLSSPFTLPCVVSTRKVQASVLVEGDAPSEPVITITATADSTGDAPEIVLKNTTTGAQITLHYGLCKGEELVVDIENRTITSNKTENMYPYLAQDSFLNQFALPQGKSEVFCHTVEPVYVTLRFDNNYGEAMY